MTSEPVPPIPTENWFIGRFMVVLKTGQIEMSGKKFTSEAKVREWLSFQLEKKKQTHAGRYFILKGDFETIQFASNK